MLAPLFVIWLGIGLASKVALAFILVAVLIFFTVYTGIRQVDRRLVERIVTLGGGRWALVRHVYLPSVAAWVLGQSEGRGRLRLHRRRASASSSPRPAGSAICCRSRRAPTTPR